MATCALHSTVMGRHTHGKFQGSGFSNNRILGAKFQGNASQENWDPRKRVRSLNSLDDEANAFHERTTRLFETLKAEVACKVAAYNQKQVEERAESRRIADLHPLLETTKSESGSNHHTNQKEGYVLVTPDAHPTTPVQIEEPINSSPGKSLSARETPAFGPQKHGSPVHDTAFSFSRSLSFKPSAAGSATKTTASSSSILMPSLLLNN